MKKNLLFSLFFILAGDSLGFAQFTPGHFFVANTPSSRSAGTDYIDEYSPDGINLGHLLSPDEQVKGVRDLAYDPGTGNLLYTVNTWEPKVFEIREIDSSGTLIRTYTHEDFGSGNIELVFDKDHTLYIANSGYLYRRLPGEMTLTQFCTLPVNPHTGHPIGIADLEIDDLGYLYLSDWAVNYNVYKISPDGSVDLFADIDDGLNNPYGIAMDSQGNLFAGNVHGSNWSIIQIDPAGVGQEFIPSGILSSGPHDLAFDNDGLLYAACRNSHQIFRFDPEGNYEIFIDETSGMNDPASIVFIPYPCEPDFDEDSDVDGSDLSQFAGSFNPGCLLNFCMAFGQN